jgi:hypothetical protein
MPHVEVSTDTRPDLAERLFEASRAESELDELLSRIGMECQDYSWNWYDVSLELHGVASEVRLTPEGRQAMLDAGFAKIYVRHVDGWETHYSMDGDVAGWRVSYPHRRGEEGGVSILVEGIYPAKWPAEWLQTGYVRVVHVPS